MLTVHVLNVGHGDSLVLEFREGADSAFAVIDSNTVGDEEPPALVKLKSLGARSLSFVAVTHPHADHYSGMKAVLEAFAGRIENIYTFPVDKDRRRLRRLFEKYQQKIASTDSKTVASQSFELIAILDHARKAPIWECPSGTLTKLVAPGFQGVEIYSILPPAKVKGTFFASIEAGTLEPEGSNLNDLSLAFCVKYKRRVIVLGGDGTYGNWMYQRKRWKADDFKLGSIAAKLPHHGSDRDCHSDVIDLLYEGTGSGDPSSVACISTDGGPNHPHPEVIDNLVARGIKPYCTSLAKRCGGYKVGEMHVEAGIDPTLLRYLGMVSTPVSGVRPCQGDITLTIDDRGVFSVTPQHRNLCPYRGDYSFLASQAVQ